jgi:predicted phosphate transport protein (TIGR00153 family)
VAIGPEDVPLMVLDAKRYTTGELANVTQMVDEHFRLALSANKMLVSAMFAWLDEGKAITHEDLARSTEYEEKGNDIKRSILNALAAAHSLMQREDLLRLVNINDKLLDGAEIACYHLAAFMSEWVPDGELKRKVAELGQSYLDVVTESREAVRFLSINIESAIAKTTEICRIEKKIDSLMRDVWSLLYPSSIPIATIMRMRDFVNTLEEVTNICEDAANTILGISLTLNS